MIYFSEDKLAALEKTREAYSLLAEFEKNYKDYLETKEYLCWFLNGLVEDTHVFPLPFTYKKNKSLGDGGYDKEILQGMLDIIQSLEAMTSLTRIIIKKIRDIFDEDSFIEGDNG